MSGWEGDDRDDKETWWERRLRLANEEVATWPDYMTNQPRRGSLGMSDIDDEFDGVEDDGGFVETTSGWPYKVPYDPQEAEIARLRAELAAARESLEAARPILQNFAGDDGDVDRAYDLCCQWLDKHKETGDDG